MKSSIIKYLYISLVSFIISSSLISCGGESDDATIQTKINAITQTTPELQGVSATVTKGVVTLIGQCKSEKDRERAEKKIKDVDDVDEVINNITISENLVVTSDSELRDQASVVLRKYKRARADVSNGVITLRGSVDKDDLSQLMMDLNNLRPKRVDNQLVVE